MANFSENDLEKILIEDNSLQRINYPAQNQKFELTKEKIYIFKNGEKFKGRIIKNKYLLKGVYIWPNNQIFYGDLSPNNTFNKKGKIIFPNKDELTGTFNPENNTITKAIYKTQTRNYQGSFKNNRLDGKFIIKNNDNCEHYVYIGSYSNGIRDGKFSLEKIYKGNKIKVIGKYENGKKNGVFKVFNLDEKDEKLILEEEYEIGFVRKEKIEYKDFFEYKEKSEIYCMEIIEEKYNLFLLLGAYEYLLIYSINIDQKEIKFITKELLFKKGNINDILKLKDGKLLLCSSNNNIIFIELFLQEKNLNISNSLKTNKSDDYFLKIIQELKGQSNSINIYSLVELSNEIVVSGDCQNIILWKKSYIKKINSIYSNISNISDNNSYKITDEKNEQNSNKREIINELEGNIENQKENKGVEMNKLKKSRNLYDKCNNLYYEFKKGENKKYTHTYCMLEIKNEKNNIILALAQPDTESIEFIKISENNIIEEIHKIENVKGIPSLNNIMVIYGDYLLVGSINNLIIIDLNSYKINCKIYNNVSITHINCYLGEYLIFGCKRSIGSYNYERFLSQKKLIIDNNKKNLISVSDFKKSKFEDNIINSCKYSITNKGKQKEVIIIIGTDGKILILII